LTGDPPEMAARATAALAGERQLLLADVALAECVYVLESYYEIERIRVAELMRAVMVLPSVAVVDVSLLLRTFEVYEVDGLHFVDAYLVANSETTGVGAVMSFDRAIDRVETVLRVEP
jgi:predicted nucleic-acid-binding protein